MGRAQIAEGTALLTADAAQRLDRPVPVAGGHLGRAREAPRAEDTDWPQILALYDLLKRMSDNPW